MVIAELWSKCHLVVQFLCDLALLNNWRASYFHPLSGKNQGGSSSSFHLGDLLMTLIEHDRPVMDLQLQEELEM